MSLIVLLRSIVVAVVDVDVVLLPIPKHAKVSFRSFVMFIPCKTKSFFLFLVVVSSFEPLALLSPDSLPAPFLALLFSEFPVGSAEEEEVASLRP